MVALLATMSMTGYMTKSDKIEWAERTRAAEAESAEAWKKEQEAKNGEHEPRPPHCHPMPLR